MDLPFDGGLERVWIEALSFKAVDFDMVEVSCVAASFDIWGPGVHEESRLFEVIQRQLVVRIVAAKIKCSSTT